MSFIIKEKIIERMKAKNLSIAKLERRAGLSIHSVRNILIGKIRNPSAQSLQAIAEALDCSIIDLMNVSPAIDEGYAFEALGKIRKDFSLDYLDLMLECSQKVLDIITEKNLKVSVDECLEVIKTTYFYSSKEEPRKFDMRFAKWFIERQFESQKTSL